MQPTPLLAPTGNECKTEERPQWQHWANSEGQLSMLILLHTYMEMCGCHASCSPKQFGKLWLVAASSDWIVFGTSI